MPPRVYVAIVDDDESLCRSFSRLLREVGFHAIAFHSAEEFLADPLRAHFGCLVVDVQLLGMSGIQLHQKLVSGGDRVPVVYITAHDDPAARAEAIGIGCAGFFRKTDAAPEILEAIRRVTFTDVSNGAGR